MTKKPRRVFLSHASADGNLAKKLKALLKGALQGQVFCSSDLGDIKSNEEWFDKIMDQLNQATVCVAIMTPNSLFFSPWVHFEVGGAYLRYRNDPRATNILFACALGLKQTDLPSPFDKLQVRNLAYPSELRTLVFEIGNFLGSGTPKINGEDAVSAAAMGPPHWRFVSPVLMGRRQGESPFNLLSMLQRAKSTLFCAGFNLNHIATSSELQNKLFDWLKKPKHSVWLLLSDPAKKQTFAAWRLVGESYLMDLDKSVKNFRSWLKEGKRLKLKKSQLDIRKTAFFAQTVLAIDPDSAAGEIVITPTIHGGQLSALRPHFCLSKARQPEEFAYYWHTYLDVFKRAAPL